MISTKNKKAKGDSVTEYRVDHRIRRRGDMWVEVIIRAPLVLEIREAAHDCQAEPGRYCEEIIEQWCAERRLNKVKLGIPLSPRLRHTVEHDELFDREDHNVTTRHEIRQAAAKSQSKNTVIQ